MIKFILPAAIVLAAPAFSFGAGQLTVTAVNQLAISRPSQTIELTASDLAPLGESDLDRIHVQDSDGRDLIVQAVDTNYDDYHEPDEVIFQSDFAPNQTKTFTVLTGKKHEFTPGDYKAYGRFVRERFDDFAWENDRIAHRMYGKALETWKGEPLSSSAVDIWTKSVSDLVLNEWYMMGDAYYHKENAQGADDYSAGRTRGCGGNGLWAGDQMWVSRNFVKSRVLANGPIRVLFELVYEPFDVNGISVSEVKRISLDAGQNFDHFESFYTAYAGPRKHPELTTAIGLKKVSGEQKEFNGKAGWLVSWQKMEPAMPGYEGVAVIVDPKLVVRDTEDKLNNLLLAKVPSNDVASYWAGFAWQNFGPAKSADAWKTYVDQFAQGLSSPIQVSVAEK